MQIRSVNIQDNKHLLSAIMKSSGPFYQFPNGDFYQDDSILNDEAYVDVLSGARVFEVTGAVNFEKLKYECLSL